MYILQNAWKNIGRNKGRNILMGTIILAIIAASSIALIISNTAAGIIGNYKQRFGSEVSISINIERFIESSGITPQTQSGGGRRINMAGGFRMPQIAPEQYLDFGESEYLKEAKYDASVGVHNSDSLNFIDEELGGSGAGMSGMSTGGGDRALMSAGPSGGLAYFGGDDFYANLLGYNYVPDEFSEGKRQIAGGRYPENDGECIISGELLENSGLEIGDTITLASTLRTYIAFDEPEIVENEDGSESELYGETLTQDIGYALTIVGYYDDLTDEYTNDFMQNAYTNRRNEIITTAGTIIGPMVDGYTGINVSAKYYLADPAMLENFAAELYAKGLDENYDVLTDEAGYNTIVKPVEGLKGITLVFLAAVLILGAVILVLLSSIAIRERKYEIGVLRAMGMKKNKVALGLLSEMITITLACLVLGLGAGIAAAQPVSDMLLENQLEQIAEQNSGANNMAFGPMGGAIRTVSAAGGMRIGGPANMSAAEALKEMDVSLGGATILQIISVSLALAAAASIAGIAHVTRYEPIKILSERN